MLPAGKYVVEMIVPPGYELVKEEDKNILMGDTYEAPVTHAVRRLRQHLHHAGPGRGRCFLQRQQSSDADHGEGAQPRHEGDTGSVETFWPCVGTARIVPDYMSLFPGRGRTRRLPVRRGLFAIAKKWSLEDQMSVLAKFYVFTSTHVAGHLHRHHHGRFHLGIRSLLARASARSSQPPYLPVSDQGLGRKRSLPRLLRSVGNLQRSDLLELGREPARSERIHTADDGDVHERSRNWHDARSALPGRPTASSATSGRSCLARPAYLDTPVIPTTAFAEGYNHPDCAYPGCYSGDSRSRWRMELDLGFRAWWLDTPSRFMPWATRLSTTTVIPVLRCLDGSLQSEDDHAPLWLRRFARHGKCHHRRYSRPDVVSWSDSTIVVTVPNDSGHQVPLCSVQQQAQYGGPAGTGNGARCGELVITAGKRQEVGRYRDRYGRRQDSDLLDSRTERSSLRSTAPRRAT